MARCKSCSAPLPANSNRCKYCGIRNDVDLHGKLDFSLQHESEYLCPHCKVPLQTIQLELAEPFHIERCRHCYGLFFDPGEINFLLEHSVSAVYEVNLKQLKNINKDRYRIDNKVRYIKCPVCRTLMNRVNFAHRSGVIIDKCRNHGVWLDSGEITHLMEWKKAGGQLLQEAQTDRELQQKKKTRSAVRRTNEFSFISNDCAGSDLGDDLVDVVCSAIFKLFK